MSMSLKRAERIAADPAGDHSLETIRAAGAVLVDAMSDAADQWNGYRVAVQRIIDMERRRLVSDYSPEAAAYDELVIWDLDDETDPTGEMRHVARAMSKRVDETWTPRQIHEQLGALDLPLPMKRLRKVLMRMRESGILESPHWGEYCLSRSGQGLWREERSR